MKFGLATMGTDEGLPPTEIAREAEALGFESIFVPDHSHVPVHRSIPYAGPRKASAPGWTSDMPRVYYRMREQLINLTAMASVTSTLKVGTGVCLVIQRDPIWLAKEVASLDQLSGGRLLFGVGAGAPHNPEEIANHGTDFSRRYKVLRERIEAMKEIWANESAEYHGEFVDFGPIYSWPKPLQDPHPPILVGGWGPTILDRVVAYGDGWIPGHPADPAAFRAQLDELHGRAAQLGRGPMDITIHTADLDSLDLYAELGVTRCLFSLPETPHHEVRVALGEIARRVQDYEMAPAR
jgi:probable F420-dependent oxidoreductase